MATSSGAGDWLLAKELFERGDRSFVEVLRDIHDADLLGNLAKMWFMDPRRASRELLYSYLEQPLNAYRHEALVKRLFKLAEAKQDDPLMGRFLACFDRCLRRSKQALKRTTWTTVKGRESFRKVVSDLESQGYTVQSQPTGKDRWQVWATRSSHVLRSKRFPAMPRGTMVDSIDYAQWKPKVGYAKYKVPDWVLVLGIPPSNFVKNPAELKPAYLAKLQNFRLYSKRTRRYLQRRAWRYFRLIGKRQPERYVSAVTEALLQYRDEDVADSVALIDNWGLIHILFHHSPVLTNDSSGWKVVTGRSLSELKAAPIYEHLWTQAPQALLNLLLMGRCRPVRRWAVQMIEKNLEAMGPYLSADLLLGLLEHREDEVVSLAARMLPYAPGLEKLSPARWLKLLETHNTQALESICELVVKYLDPDRLTLSQVIRLTGMRPIPVARLGLSWLQGKTPQTLEDCQSLLELAEAQAEPIRGEIVRTAQSLLKTFPAYQPRWPLEFLDSRHREVRAEGWAWLKEDPRSSADTVVWQRLFESPYDDVRLMLVAELEERWERKDLDWTEGRILDPELLRLLWASVLLNIHRGGRSKPRVLHQLLNRLQHRPGEAGALLPVLAVAVRSVRAPEWRAGLAALVQLVARRPETREMVRVNFPELQFVGQ